MKTPLAFCTSFGTSTTTGPGRPLRAMSKARRIVSSILVSSVTRKTCLAQGAMMLKTGASWKASVPIAARGTWPVMRITGIESAWQSRIGVTELVAPGPEVTRKTPTLPLERA